MRLLGALLLAALAGAGGWSQVRLETEVGCQGIPVAGAVNPLRITVENRSPSALVATLHAVQEVGSSWRGRVTQRLRAPLLLPPGGRVRLLFPWPVEAGAEPLTVWVEAEGRELARSSVPIRPTFERPVAVVGAGGDINPGPAVFLAPEDLPTDPVLLSPFRLVVLTALPGPRASEALRAWAASEGGVEGWPVPPPLPRVGEEALWTSAREHLARRAPVALLLPLVVAYLALLGYALPPLQRGQALPVALLCASFTAFALFYPVLFGGPHNTMVVQFSISRSDVTRYSIDEVVIASLRGDTVVLPGHWVERRQASSEHAYGAIAWEWDGEGVRTSVRVQPGQALILYRYGEEWTGEGGSPGTGFPGGFAPLGDVLRPLLGEGDRVIAGSSTAQEGGRAWWTYRVRWERGG